MVETWASLLGQEASELSAGKGGGFPPVRERKCACEKVKNLGKPDKSNTPGREVVFGRAVSMWFVVARKRLPTPCRVMV
jgi:hypothetical protein